LHDFLVCLGRSGDARVMKVAIVHVGYMTRGGEDVCVENEYQALRTELRNVLLINPKNDPSLAAIENAILAPFQNRLMKKVERQITDFHPDVLHVHNVFPTLSPRLFQFAVRQGIRTVLTLHNFRPLCLNGLFLTPKGETCERCTGEHYQQGIIRGCYRDSRLSSALMATHLWKASKEGWYDDVDLFIAPSIFLRNKFIAGGFLSDRIVFQPHFQPNLPHISPISGKGYVLFLGRLSIEKGLRWLIKAFQSPRYGLKLLIAGTGPMENEVRAAVNASIEFKGYVTGEKKDELIQGADLLVIPSVFYENSPMTIVEANGWGVPVLVNDNGGLKNIARPGENGQMYLHNNEESFWKQVRLILDHPEQRQRSQDYARTHFSEKQFLKQRLSLYEGLVANATQARLRIDSQGIYNASV